MALLCAAGQNGASSASGFQAGAKTCVPSPRVALGPDADLYCIELLPAGEIEAASGTAHLLAPSSPFGVAVTEPASICTTSSSICRVCRTRILRAIYDIRRLGHDTAARSGRETRRSHKRHGHARTRAVRPDPDSDHGRSLRRGDRTCGPPRAARHVGQRAHAAARSGVPPRRPARTARELAPRGRRPANGRPRAARRQETPRARGRRRRCTRRWRCRPN